MYKNLRAFRESLKMTQEEFGKSVGVAKTTYNNYETGKREPDSEFWIKIAEKYGVSIDYLMGYKDEPYKQKEKPFNSAEAEPEGTEKWLIDLLVKGGYIPARSPFTKSPPRAGFSFFPEFMRVCGAFSVFVVLIQKAGKTPKNQPMQHEMQHEKRGRPKPPCF